MERHRRTECGGAVARERLIEGRRVFGPEGLEGPIEAARRELAALFGGGYEKGKRRSSSVAFSQGRSVVST